MVQEHYVLKCVTCQTFQSQIVKKAKKWECKICSTKQSLMKVYGQGSGKDCRIHTQKLNSLKGEKEVEVTYQSEEIIETCCKLQQPIEEPVAPNNKILPRKRSKWDEYCDETEVSGDEEFPSNETPNNENLTLRVMNAKKRKLSETDKTDCDFEYNGFTKLSHCSNAVPLNSSVSDYSFKQYNAYKSLETNSIVETTEENIQSSLNTVKNQGILNEKSGLYFNNGISLQNCSELGKDSDNSSSYQLHDDEPSNLNKYRKTNQVGILSDIYSNYNCDDNKKGELFIKSSCNSLYKNNCSKSITDQKCHAKNLMTNTSIFEQECDLSDSEFQLDF